MIEVQKHQTLLDIAIQHTGSVESVVEIAELNGLEVTADVVPGTKLIMPEVVERRVKIFFDESDSKPVTATERTKETGIEFWAIEGGFIVS
jgi:hypothetical protein